MTHFLATIILTAVTGILGVNEELSTKYLRGLDSTPFILIDKQDLTLSVIDSTGAIFKTYGIACARNYGPKSTRGDNRTPEGRFSISQILNSSSLYHDFGDGKGKIPGAYGPWFLRLDVPGFIDIGIHGTHLPESIGSRCTEGCIRMRNEDVSELKEMVVLGMPVVILPEDFGGIAAMVDSALNRIEAVPEMEGSPAGEDTPEVESDDSEGSDFPKGIASIVLGVCLGIVIKKLFSYIVRKK